MGNDLANNGKYLKSVNAGEFVLVGPIVENVDYNGVAKTVISPAGSTGFDPVGYNGNLDQILPFVHVATDSFLQYEISENDRAVMFPAGGGAYNYDNTSAGEFTFTVNT